MPPLVSDVPRTKHARLTRSLRDRIARGELRPGDRLPSFSELRTRHGIAISTIEKILSTLEQEGLVERRQGSGTFVKQPQRTLTGNIGFIGSAAFRAQQSPFYVEIMRGVQDAAQRHERRVLLLGTDRDWDAAAFSTVDGLLLCGHSEQTNLKIRDAAPVGTPCISLITSGEGLSSVVSDDYGGGRIAVRELLQLGHRRIACLMTKETSVLRGRFAGYTDALQAAGLMIDPCWTRMPEVSSLSKFTSQEWAREQMRIWLYEGWQETGCTALLAQNDAVAVGAMQVLQEAGIKIPQQVSIVGFDGTELCDYTSPRLAAVRLPLEQMGAKAIELLATQTDEFCELQTTVLPASWRAGDSIAPAPKSF